MIQFITASLYLLLSISSSHALEIQFEKNDALPLVYVNAAIKIGAAQDPEEKSGMANLMGEMMLRGTQSRTKEQLDQAIDQLGARLECETRTEAIVFRGAVLKSQFKAFSEVFLDILTHPRFPDSELVKIKSEVHSKILEQQGKDNILAKRHFESWFFGNHPYSKPIIGKMKTLPTISSQDLKNHYKKWVHSANMVIVGTGDLETESLNEFGEKLKKLRPTGEVPADIPLPVVENKRRMLFIDKPDRTQTQIYVGQLGLKLTDSKYHAIYLGNHAYGGSTFTARMMTEIRAKRGWSYGAYSYFKNATQPHLWQYYLFPASKDTVAALKKSLEMLDDLKKSGITSAEFETAKRSLVNNAGFNYNTPLKRVENALNEKILRLPTGFYKEFGKELEKLSLTDVNRAIQSFIDPKSAAISVLGTASQLKAPATEAAGLKPGDVKTVNFSEDL